MDCTTAQKWLAKRTVTVVHVTSHWAAAGILGLDHGVATAIPCKKSATSSSSFTDSKSSQSRHRSQKVFSMQQSPGEERHSGKSKYRANYAGMKDIKNTPGPFSPWA